MQQIQFCFIKFIDKQYCMKREELSDVMEFCAQYNLLTFLKDLPITQVQKQPEAVPQIKKVKKGKFQKPTAVHKKEDKKNVKGKFEKPRQLKKQVQSQESYPSKNSYSPQSNLSPKKDINYFINHMMGNKSKFGYETSNNAYASSFKARYEENNAPFSNTTYQKNSNYQIQKNNDIFAIPDFSQRMAKAKNDYRRQQKDYGSFTDRKYQRSNLNEENRPRNFNENLFSFPNRQDQTSTIKKMPDLIYQQSYDGMERSQISSRTHDTNLLYESPQRNQIISSPIRRDNQNMSTSNSCFNFNLSPDSYVRQTSNSKSNKSKKKNVERPFYEPPKGMKKMKDPQENRSQISQNPQQRYQPQQNYKEAVQTQMQAKYNHPPPVQYVNPMKRETMDTGFSQQSNHQRTASNIVYKKSTGVEMDDDFRDYLTIASQSRIVPTPIPITSKYNRQ